MDGTDKSIIVDNSILGKFEHAAIMRLPVLAQEVIYDDLGGKS